LYCYYDLKTVTITLYTSAYLQQNVSAMHELAPAKHELYVVAKRKERKKICMGYTIFLTQRA